jgi:hypothetical protein
MIMKLADVIRNINSIEIDASFVLQVEDLYCCKLPEDAARILCIPVNEENYDEQVILRKLSRDMILEASEEMNSDFIGYKLLPLFDCGDNDYICYDFENNIWCMFNIVDDSIFNKHKGILDLL